MTTTQENETPVNPNVEAAANAATSWASNAVTLAGLIASENFARGDLAQLRRMDPDSPDVAVFWKLLAGQDLLDSGPAVELKWSLILHGIALMTPTNVGDGNTRTAHEGSIPLLAGRCSKAAMSAVPMLFTAKPALTGY